MSENNTGELLTDDGISQAADEANFPSSGSANGSVPAVALERMLEEARPTPRDSM